MNERKEGIIARMNERNKERKNERINEREKCIEESKRVERGMK